MAVRQEATVTTTIKNSSFLPFPPVFWVLDDMTSGASAKLHLEQG